MRDKLEARLQHMRDRLADEICLRGERQAIQHMRDRLAI